jgi:RNA polymerase sigma-70 factor, sigma-E family
VEPEESFRDYVSARVGTLSRAAYLLTGDRHSAEDLVQLTLVQAARHWERLVAQGDPDAYVRRVMYTQHVSMWRRRWRQVDLRAEPPEVPARDSTAGLADALMVRDALRRLAPRQRAVLVLRYFEDLTEAEAAEALGCSVSTVKSQTRDALARLRALAPELADLVATPRERTAPAPHPPVHPSSAAGLSVVAGEASGPPDRATGAAAETAGQVAGLPGGGSEGRR